MIPHIFKHRARTLCNEQRINYSFLLKEWRRFLHTAGKTDLEATAGEFGRFVAEYCVIHKTMGGRRQSLARIKKYF